MQQLMQRRRQAHGREVLRCLLCNADRTFVLYEFWRATSLLSRRRLDVRWRWQCLTCGTRLAANVRTGPPLSDRV